MNAGVRYEIFQGGVGETSSPAGRFVPGPKRRRTEAWPTFKDWAPRFNVVYDLFGNAKTALKSLPGKYVSTIGGSTQVALYNPISIASETRNWFDCDLVRGTSTCSALALATNGDNIAQDNEIAASTNPRFGRAAELRADPDLAREHSWDYSLGVQHELLPRVSLAAAWYHTRNGNLWANQDALYTVTDWTRFDIPNPCLSDPKCGVGRQRRCHHPGLQSQSGHTDGRYLHQIVRASTNGPTTGSRSAARRDWPAARRSSPGSSPSTPSRGRATGTTRTSCATAISSARCSRSSATTVAPPFQNEIKLSVSQPLPWSFLGQRLVPELRQRRSAHGCRVLPVRRERLRDGHGRADRLSGRRLRACRRSSRAGWPARFR